MTTIFFRGLAVAFAIAVVGAGQSAVAGGFYVPEIGGRGTGLASAMTADSSDPSTIFHNPAGLVGIAGSQVEVGGLMVLPDISYFRRPVQDPVTGDTVRFARVSNANRIAGVPFIGATFQTRNPRLSIGFAVYVPFGATLEFPATGAQRFAVTEIAMRTIYAGPAIAYRVTPRLSVGAAINYIYADLRLRQANALQFVTGDPEANPNPDPGVEGQTRITASDHASLGATVGVQWGGNDDPFTVGISVMAPTTIDLRGTAVVTNPAIMEIVDPNGGATLPAGSRTDDVLISMPLPMVVRVGMLVRPSNRVHLAMDVNWQRWSTLQKLTIDFKKEPALLLTPGATLYDVVMDNRWRDTLSVRIGANVVPVATRPLQLRAGLFYDQSPIDDRHFDLVTPDSDKLGVATGGSYTFPVGARQLRFDLGAVALFLRDRNIAPGDRVDPATGTVTPGSDRTILNKPAPSFYYGVTRASVRLVNVSATLLF